MIRISEGRQRLLSSAAAVLAVFAVIYLIITHLMGYIAPFLIALLITSIIENPVRFLMRRLRLSRGAAAALVILVFTGVAGTLIGLLFYRLLLEVWNMTRESPGISQIIQQLMALVAQSETLYLSLPEEILAQIQSNLNAVGRTLLQWVNGLLNMLLRILQSLPLVFLYIIISLVSAFFLSRDREKISQFVFAQMPEVWGDKIRGIKGDLLAAMAGYVKAQMILISITFLQVLIGYSLLGLRYAFFLAVITAIFDLLPILGPGTILIPGAILNIIWGQSSIGFFFLLLYISVLVARQFLEPRIVGGHIGLHPLVTLIFIFVGFRLFGVFGIILGPVMAILIKSLQKARILPQFK